VVNAEVITADHVVGIKADGTRATLKIGRAACCFVMRNKQVVPANVMRPSDCEEAALDGELMWPTEYGEPVRFHVFDAMWFVSRSRGNRHVHRMTFAQRSEFVRSIVKELDDRIAALADAGGGPLRPWSWALPAPATTQTVRLTYKPFFCPCYTFAFVEATGALPPEGPGRPSPPPLCRLGRAPHAPPTLTHVRALARQGLLPPLEVGGRAAPL